MSRRRTTIAFSLLFVAIGTVASRARSRPGSAAGSGS